MTRWFEASFWFVVVIWLAMQSVAVAAGIADPSAIARGKYLALAGDCQACHTVDQSKPMAGGYAVPTPFGTIYSPNITPDRETGIGTWTDDDFLRAMHQGIGKGGHNLYPAFPYDSFTLLSNDDVLAIKSYLFSLQPIHNVVPANDLSFPFNQRWILWGWKLLNFHDGRFKPDPHQSSQWNRGAYLVQALEHCGTCHTPRNITMGMENRRALGGGSVGAWQAFNITPDRLSGIGGWTEQELQSYLSRGIARDKARAAGPMAEAVEHSLSQLSSDDLQAIITYVGTLRPIPNAHNERPRFAYGNPATFEASLRGASGIVNDVRTMSGAELYSANCASCHGPLGAGSQDGYFPPLFHNSTVGARRPNNLVMVILNGVQRQTSGDNAFMPAFSALSNDELVTLVNWAEQQFGNPELQVTKPEIAKFGRGRGPASPDSVVVIGVLGAGIAILILVAFARHRFGRRPAPAR